jgi:hypothetical protein
MKSVSPDFMKNKFLCVLCVSAVKTFFKRLKCYQYSSTPARSVKGKFSFLWCKNLITRREGL